MTQPRISVVIPVLNEAPAMAEALDALHPLRSDGVEVVVVDGGSTDGTLDRVTGRADRVLSSPPGRAVQQNAGAAAASGDVLLFLHADTRLPAGAATMIRTALRDRPWGRFDVRLSGKSPVFRLIERLMSLRSRLTGIATGDQAIFVRREAYEAVGGFPAIPLMEDLALSRALRRLSRPVCLEAAVTTSSRRWESRGVARTVLLMWRLRLAYWFGADPVRLAARYR